jgi:malate dehydrogenase (oxaloacetate-decarboxylating)(NADP+)
VGARAARPDALIATGRSDYPNQVNNVLGFPFIFRGALDVGAQQITEGMKMAATRALAALAREDVPESVIAAYGGRPLRFGPDYLIPKPLDPRVCLWEAPAVAAAAIAEGVARRGLDMVAYKAQLEDRLGQSHALMRSLTARAARRPQRLVFSEGADERIIKAAHQLIDDDIAIPILLGSRAAVEAAAAAAGVPLTGITVVDPATDPRASRYAETLWERRRRKGVTRDSAAQLAAQPPYFASLMVGAGDADAMVGGIRQYYPDKLHAPLQVLGLEAQARAVAGAIMLMVGKNVYFLADTTLAEDPDPRAVADIALATARLVRTLGLTPRVALLSFSNFGSMRTPDTIKMAEAARILREERPDLEVDGEMMAETALNPAILRGSFPWSRLTAPANVLVFPNVAAANIGYQLVKELGGADMVGPILMGTARPVHLLRRDISVREVVYMSVIAAVDAQARADAASLGAERPAAAPHPARR